MHRVYAPFRRLLASPLRDRPRRFTYQASEASTAEITRRRLSEAAADRWFGLYCKPTNQAHLSIREGLIKLAVFHWSLSDAVFQGAEAVLLSEKRLCDGVVSTF
jgi:hypothetical protein